VRWLSVTAPYRLPQGGHTACHWPPIVLGTLREGAPVTIAVVSTAMGVSPCCWRCEDKLAVWPEGCVDGTCRFYMADEGGIIRNVISDLA